MIPEHIRNKEEKKFAMRYHLKDDEPLVRIRILDPLFAIHCNITDLSITLSNFEKMQ